MRRMQFGCSKCENIFEVSKLRLLFTRRYFGTDPVTTDVAYYLKCPNCGNRSWLVPFAR